MKHTFQAVSALLYAFALLAAVPVVAASQRHTVFISDLHVGAGKDSAQKWRATEDFRWQDDFDAFLQSVSKRSEDKADLILAGDVFELWQSPTMACSGDITKPGCVISDCHEADPDIGCSEQEALVRVNYVLDQHPGFLNAIRQFARKGSNSVHFIPGNHDAALLFPAVRAALRARLADSAVFVEEKGYWLSADGAIYSDHGHLFDYVNKFDKWPAPFRTVGAHTYLAKPWGENMVQRFYNQYEAIFPIIDNLGDEKSGVMYAVKQAGFPNSAAAIRKFFRFFLFQQSISQAADALGKESPVVYDKALTRALPTDFFVEVFTRDPSLQAMGNLAPSSADGFAPASLNDEEIDAVCAAKDKLEGARRCPRVEAGADPTLSAAIVGTVANDTSRSIAHLRSTLQRIATPPHNIASVYVLGHTHKAQMPTLLSLGEMSFGTFDVMQVNTGAFQRIASKEQIGTILFEKKHKGKSPLDLLPEDLPACYNYVWIAPYAGSKPTPTLLRWTRKDNGKYASAPGSCLAH